MMKRHLVMMLCLIAMAASMNAQSISGKLVDEKNEPLAYANIVLQQTDSTFVNGQTSDEKGGFRIEAPKPGSYLLSISSVGYRSQIIRLNDLERRRNLGTIVMTEATELLGEVSVTANATIQKADRQIVYPSQHQLKMSTSGYDLINRLMLPNLWVNPIENKISTVGGGSVELRINDVKANTQEVLALNPKEVERIEYIDDPGARYANTSVEAVINYVVKRRSSGVSGGFSTTNSFTTGFGNNSVFLNANTGKSQFGVNYYISYRDYDERYAVGTEQYTFPDGTEINRRTEGICVPFGYVSQNIQASYNLTEPDKYVFNVVFKNTMFDTDKQNFRDRIIEKGKPDLINDTHITDHSNTPSLDLYFSYQLPNNQSIAANIVGTHINTDYMYRNQEYEHEDDILSTYAYGTDGKKYSLIGEALYQKEWDNTTLTAGFKGNVASTKNIYMGDNDQTLHMHDDMQYGYVQLAGKWKKWNYRLGAGVSRHAYRQADNEFDYVAFRPSVSLTYNLFKGASLRYTLSVTPYAPSLSQLSDIPQQSSNLEINRGNKDLKVNQGYNNWLIFNWNTKRVNLQWRAQYLYRDKPILRTIRAVQDEEGRYMVEYAPINWDYRERVATRLTLGWKIIPDVLNLNLYGGVHWNKSVGDGYNHEYSAWEGGGSLSASLGKFSLMAGTSIRTKSMAGVYVDYGENDGYIQLNYTHKSLSVGASWYYPFTSEGWSAGTRTMPNRYLNFNRWTYIKDNGNMLNINLSWRFSSGRKHQAGRKTLSNSDSDSGIVK